MRRITCLVFLLSAFTFTAQAQSPQAQDRWVNWRPFLGTWQGVGNGQPGQGQGEFTFVPELQSAVLARHSYAEYPATKDKPAYRHDDLMVIYPEQDNHKLRADYWDNEGHFIRYDVTLSARQLVFLSDASRPGPRYRLTYVKTADDALNLTFEIAPAGQPQKFKTYVQAVCRRKGRASPN